jgi:AcrR family transcriptional regulator
MNPKVREEFRRQKQIRIRLARASFRLEMAELERIWAIVSAHREGLSVRDIARQVGLGPTRVHQLVTSPQADSVEHALSVLREVGWPAPEDTRPAAEEQVADRLIEEAAALVSCVEWLESLSTQETPVVNLRPEDDYPETDYVAVDQSRVIRVLRRIAHDLEELARARRVADLSSSGNDADPRMRLRRRLAEPPIELSRRGTSILQGRKAWENYEHRLQKAGLPAPLNPYRHLNRSAE